MQIKPAGGQGTSPVARAGLTNTQTQRALTDNRADEIANLDLPPHGADFDVRWDKKFLGLPYPRIVWIDD